MICAFSGCEKLKNFLARRGSASRPARPRRLKAGAAELDPFLLGAVPDLTATPRKRQPTPRRSDILYLWMRLYLVPSFIQHIRQYWSTYSCIDVLLIVVICNYCTGSIMWLPISQSTLNKFMVEFCLAALHLWLRVSACFRSRGPRLGTEL